MQRILLGLLLITALAVTRGGTVLWSSARYGTVKRWDLARGINTATYGRIQEAAISSDGSTIVYSLGDGEFHTHSLAHRRTDRVLRGFDAPSSAGSFSGGASTLAISPDGRRVAHGGYATSGFVDHSKIVDSSVTIWDTNTGKILHNWTKDPAGSLKFSPNGRQLVEIAPDVTGSESPLRVRMLFPNRRSHGFYDLTQGDMVVQGATPIFTKTGRLQLATTGYAHASEKKISGIWDVVTGKIVLPLKTNATLTKNFWDSYDASEDRRFIVRLQYTGLTLWDGRSGRPLWSHPREADEEHTEVKISPDGRWVIDYAIAGGRNQFSETPIIIHTGSTGKIITRLSGPKAGLLWLSFSTDSRRLFAVSGDGVVRVWALERRSHHVGH